MEQLIIYHTSELDYVRFMLINKYLTYSKTDSGLNIDKNVKICRYLVKISLILTKT